MEHRPSYALVLVFAILITVLVSRFMFSATPIPNVSAVTVPPSLGVYWDENCSSPVYSIDWGTLSPGELKQVVIYIRNEGSEQVFLYLTALNWNPEKANSYLHFASNSETRKISAGQVARVTQSLLVSASIRDIYDFNFEIVVEGRDHFSADINEDGSVDVYDIMTMSLAYGATPIDPEWNPNIDLNGDSFIDFYDLNLALGDYGAS